MAMLVCVVLAAGPVFAAGTSPRADAIPPRVLFEASEPRILGGDAGVPTVAPAQTIKLVFSEPMDPESLRPGIVIRINPERNEIPLIIQAPPTAGATYEVRILPAEGTYRDRVAAS